MFDVNNDVRIAPKIERINSEITSPRLRKMYEESLESGQFMSLDEFHSKLEWLKGYLKEKQHGQQDIRSERCVG